LNFEENSGYFIDPFVHSFKACSVKGAFGSAVSCEKAAVEKLL
jgi:hypothetical protein